MTRGAGWPGGSCFSLQGVADELQRRRVDEDELGAGVAEKDGDRARVEARVDVVEHGAAHGHAEVHLVHGRHVGQQHGHLWRSNPIPRSVIRLTKSSSGRLPRAETNESEGEVVAYDVAAGDAEGGERGGIAGASGTR